MTAPILLTIKRFQQRAEGLKTQGRQQGLQDSIDDLARWMDSAHVRLNEQDRAELIEIGGNLFREGLRRRMEA